jgi:hypothetical protein
MSVKDLKPANGWPTMAEAYQHLNSMNFVRALKKKHSIVRVETGEYEGRWVVVYYPGKRG